MVSITIRSDQEGPEPDVQEEIREMAPCSLALVTAVMDQVREIINEGEPS